jgi:1-acyl-sn-glycerol-3-phosphate acyltransferase
MFRLLRGPVLGTIMSVLLIASTVFWAIPIYAVVILKLISPTQVLRDRCSRLVAALAQLWGVTNVWLGDHAFGIQWDIRISADLSRDAQYLICSNHQTWNDIYVLMKAFGRRAPFFRFFIKQQLIWVPILGLAWWGLDYPFMNRYSRDQLQKNPQLRGRDMEITRKACEKYARIPVSILNFLEGTRFTPEKQARQKSPYRHLLRPKSGGFAFALSAMGERLSSMLDVTIVYPEGATSFWDFLAGRVQRVIVDVRSLRIPNEFFHGNYEADPEFRQRINSWVAAMWEEKDRRIDQLLAGAAAT